MATLYHAGKIRGNANRDRLDADPACPDDRSNMSLASISSRLVRKIMLEIISAKLRGMDESEDASELRERALRTGRNIVPFGRFRRYRTRPGVELLGDVRDVITRQLFITGDWEPGVTALIKHVLRPGGVMVDIGANVGYHALCGALRVGATGQVVAFEPAPHTRDMLQQNVSLNPKLNVEVRSQAVCNFNGEVEFFAVEEGHTGISSMSQPGHAARKIKVPAVRFDDAWSSDRPINLIKIDVEGAELQVLAGMQKTLATHRPDLIIELADDRLIQQGTSVHAIIETMREIGLNAFRIDSEASSLKIEPIDPNGTLPGMVDVYFTARS